MVFGECNPQGDLAGQLVIPAVFPLRMVQLPFRSINEIDMTELVFLVEPSPGGGYIATSLGEVIRTEAGTLPLLRRMVKDAVLRHFGAGQAPKSIRLQFV